MFDLFEEYTLWAMSVVILASFAGAWLGVWMAVRAHRRSKAKNHRRRFSDKLEDYNTGENERVVVEDLTTGGPS